MTIVLRYVICYSVYFYCVALIIMCSLDVLCGSMYDLFVSFCVRRKMGLEFPIFFFSPRGRCEVACL